ncbi:MAG: helix-turn-helix transcriptional regulator [Prevotella sp.]|nr:helix-turn-helix transcriptional regulator [Prevotella sp.]
MKHRIYILILCALLTMVASCTHSSETKDDEKAKAAWQRYHEAYDAKNLNRALAVIDSMETEKMVSTPKADHLRGLVYDQGWQMKIAEQFYKKSYQGYASDPSQDWGTYTDAGYRWAYLRFRRGDTEGALNVVTELLHQAKENESFPKDQETALLMLMAEIQLQLHHYDEALLTGQKVYEAIEQKAENGNGSELDMAWGCINISDIHHKTGDTKGAMAWLDRCAHALTLAKQEQRDSLMIEEWKGHVALKQALYLLESGHANEAQATYAAIPRSRLMEPIGYREAADYLMAAGRYDEAADWYERIDSTYLATDGAKMTFDIIATRLSPRYMAYRKAGRNANALLLADSVSAAIDSALVWQKQNDAAELAVIYQTYEKELALNDAKSETRIHRVLLAAAILVILLIGYLFWRARKYNKELLEKNRRLLADIEQREQEEQQAIVQLKAEPKEKLTANQQLFCRICDLMDSSDHIYTDADLDRNRLAQLLGTNEHYVTDAISTCTDGKSVNGFLNEYRLRYAARLLATTTDAVAIIAELSGFSRSSFFRIFSDAYGMSPSDYRRVARK